MSFDQAALAKRRATHLLELGQIGPAIEQLRQVLATDPDDAHAHALLANCLLAQKRVHAASHEAGLALSLDPDSVFGHLTMAHCALAARQIATAQKHLALAKVDGHMDASVWLTESRLATLINDRTLRAQALARAHELEPENTEVLVGLALHAFDQRRFDEADKWTTEALSLEPESVGALVMAGQLALQRGAVSDAREHALWALQIDPSDESAMRLFASIKARQSLLLGAWWRLMAWLSIGGIARSTVILIAFYVLYRLLEITLDLKGYTEARSAANIVWLLFVLYTWTAPALFARSLKKELGSVRLRSDF
ncbi:hypothetical protein C7S18_17800 [Ahniella affigens]|uniref:Uncharacterized protein n=1 Tax=Ahniella affigens TaxID=2021234 RepID=A0A2P1PVP7_9GAMM|nr:tetratricopeptide repeat protein [Ahniella affigens]AVP98919.1 hypothetical protein C7S18_17800 [Ahniella affigens]